MGTRDIPSILFVVIVGSLLLGMLVVLYVHDTGPTYNVLKSEFECTAHHTETVVSVQAINNVTIVSPNSSDVCDVYSRIGGIDE